MNITWIDFDRLEVYEAGAFLVTLLGYPEEGEETRSEVHASLCAHALRVKCAMEPDWALPSQPIKPIAEYHEALIAQSRHLRIAPERLIRFRLA